MAAFSAAMPSSKGMPCPKKCWAISTYCNRNKRAGVADPSSRTTGFVLRSSESETRPSSWRDGRLKLGAFDSASRFMLGIACGSYRGGILRAKRLEAMCTRKVLNDCRFGDRGGPEESTAPLSGPTD